MDRHGNHRVILIDTSPDLREQVLRLRLERCDAILYTHHHVDHTFGLDEVRRFNVLMQQPINVYGEPITIEHLRRVYRHIFDADSNTNASFVAELIANPLAPERLLEMFGLRILPLRLMHGRLPILGFRFERTSGGLSSSDDESDPFPLAYCTDVSAIPPETWPRLSGLKTLFLDALRHRHHPTHFNFDQAIAAALEIKAESTYFVHMTHDVHHETTETELPEGIHLAWDGLTLGSLD